LSCIFAVYFSYLYLVFCNVTGIIQGKRGKGSGFIKAKLKSLVNGTSFERTFISDDIVEHAELENEEATYSWEDTDDLVFMNSRTFEEIRISKSEVENSKFIKEGQDVKLQKFNEKIIGITKLASHPLFAIFAAYYYILGVQIPIVVQLEVTSVDASAQGGLIRVRLCSGASVSVPEHIKVGDAIKVNTTDGTYIERA